MKVYPYIEQKTPIAMYKNNQLLLLKETKNQFSCKLTSSAYRMQCIPKDRILEHLPDTLMSIRTEYNFEKPEAMEDAIRILREWVDKQQYFKYKDFTDYYLETIIISCKGSIERAKRQMDRMCTFRTLLPQFFGVYNAKTDFKTLFDVVTPVILPKLTPDHYRVFIVNVKSNVYLIKDYLEYFIYNLIVAEYIKVHDYCRGFLVIIDLTEVNIMDFVPNLNPVQFKQALTIFIEGIGMRIKGIHIHTPSKLVDSFVTILKQVASQKISARIHTHKSLEDLPNIVPLDILPEDYGGKERSLRTLLEEWHEVLASEENIAYLEVLNQVGTDESYRQTEKFNEEYAGTPGTFRSLNVD